MGAEQQTPCWAGSCTVMPCCCCACVCDLETSQGGEMGSHRVAAWVDGTMAGQPYCKLQTLKPSRDALLRAFMQQLSPQQLCS